MKVFSYHLCLKGDSATVGNGDEATLARGGRFFKGLCFVIAGLITIQFIGEAGIEHTF